MKAVNGGALAAAVCGNGFWLVRCEEGSALQIHCTVVSVRFEQFAGSFILHYALITRFQREELERRHVAGLICQLHFLHSYDHARAMRRYIKCTNGCDSAALGYA